MNDTPVTELMTTPVLTVKRDECPADVSRAMSEQEIKSVVVIDEDCHPVGVLTSTDYIEMTASGIDPHQTAVEEFMATDVITVTTGASVETVADRMLDNDISHLPVVDDDDQVVGIVTTTDLTEHLGARV